MNQKTTILNAQRLADDAGLHLYCLPPLKDRYIENHIYQEGGIVYVFLKDKEETKAFLALAEQTPEIERVMTARDAAATYQLPAEDIGDYVLFAAPDCAFGEIDGTRLAVRVQHPPRRHPPRSVTGTIRLQQRYRRYRYGVFINTLY